MDNATLYSSQGYPHSNSIIIVITMKLRLQNGQCYLGFVIPFSVCFTQVLLTPIGTSFSDLQATVQAWHPMHFLLSIIKSYFMQGGSFLSAIYFNAGLPSYSKNCVYERMIMFKQTTRKKIS